MTGAVLAMLGIGLVACARGPSPPPSHVATDPAEPLEETLASTFDGAMAIDELHVFWAARDGIWRVAKRRGSTPSRLARAERPQLLELDSQAAWWLAGDRVQTVQKAGGEVRTLPTRRLEHVWSLVRHGDELVIGESDPERMKSTIVRVAATDGAPIAEITLDGQAPSLASGPDGLYVGTDVALVRIRGDGQIDTLSVGSPEQPIEVRSIVLDRDAVLFSSFCDVRRVARAGGPTTVLGCKSGAVQQLATDETYVYWAVAWNESPGDGIYRVRARGGEVELVTLVDATATAIALDRTHVYWGSSSGQIKRRRRGP